MQLMSNEFNIFKMNDLIHVHFDSCRRILEPPFPPFLCSLTLFVCFSLCFSLAFSSWKHVCSSFFWKKLRVVYRPQCCYCCCCCYRKKHINATHCLLFFTLKKVPSLPLWGFFLKKGEGKKRRFVAAQRQSKTKKNGVKKVIPWSSWKNPTTNSQGKDNVKNRVTTFVAWEREKEREWQRTKEKGNTCA